MVLLVETSQAGRGCEPCVIGLSPTLLLTALYYVYYAACLGFRQSNIN